MTLPVLWHFHSDGVTGPCMVVVWLGPGDVSVKPETHYIIMYLKCT